MTVRTLRRQLFRSHLQVMFVALGVMVAMTIAGFVLVIVITGDDFVIGPGGPHLDRKEEDAVGAVFPLVVLGAAIGAASYVGWRVSKRLGSPLESLGATTRELASGNYDVSIEPTGIEELDQLGTDVQSLATALAETEARRLRLIGDIAHELRTPLSTIEGSMEALMDGVMPADDATFAGIAREAARLRRLANDLSALSSSAEQDMLTDARPVDVAALAQEVGDLLGVQAEAKGLTLLVAADAPAMVTGNADRLAQVLTNVVGNAIQYTETGRIDLAATATADRVIVTVTDTGRGLDRDELTKVFDRFYRTDEHYADGTGVGLTIAQQIVWAHGGALTAESPGVGRGTTFTIALPAAGSA
ncbi:MAG: ATP-binding protein [Actinomycetota bacterium]